MYWHNHVNTQSKYWSGLCDFMHLNCTIWYVYIVCEIRDFGEISWSMRFRSESINHTQKGGANKWINEEKKQQHTTNSHTHAETESDVNYHSVHISAMARANHVKMMHFIHPTIRLYGILDWIPQSHTETVHLKPITKQIKAKENYYTARDMRLFE